MKVVVAFVRRRMLENILTALQDIDGLTGASLQDVKGFGRGRARNSGETEWEEGFLLLSKVRMEIYCSDNICGAVVDALRNAAHTGLRGDGKVYIADVEQAVRISSGESGDLAV